MNPLAVILALALLLIVARRKKTITTADGTYRLIRPQGRPDKTGAFDVELWSKDGVDPKEYVYLRQQWANGSPHFTRILA